MLQCHAAWADAHTAPRVLSHPGTQPLVRSIAAFPLAPPWTGTVLGKETLFKPRKKMRIDKKINCDSLEGFLSAKKRFVSLKATGQPRPKLRALRSHLLMALQSRGGDRRGQQAAKSPQVSQRGARACSLVHFLSTVDLNRSVSP